MAGKKCTYATNNAVPSHTLGSTSCRNRLVLRLRWKKNPSSVQQASCPQTYHVFNLTRLHSWNLMPWRWRTWLHHRGTLNTGLPCVTCWCGVDASLDSSKASEEGVTTINWMEEIVAEPGILNILWEWYYHLNCIFISIILGELQQYCFMHLFGLSWLWPRKATPPSPPWIWLVVSN